jgi:hypothetical protein
MYKIEPALFDTWMRILVRSPNSVIWLQERARERCRCRAPRPPAHAILPYQAPTSAHSRTHMRTRDAPPRSALLRSPCPHPRCPLPPAPSISILFPPLLFQTAIRLPLQKFPEDAIPHLKRRAESLGVNASRLVFTHRISKSQHVRAACLARCETLALLSTLTYC